MATLIKPGKPGEVQRGQRQAGIKVVKVNPAKVKIERQKKGGK